MAGDSSGDEQEIVEVSSTNVSHAGLRRGFLVSRWGWVILPLAGAMIIGAVAYKLSHPKSSLLSPQGVTADAEIAPPFQLHDQNSKMVRLAAYQGRHKIVVLFYAANPPADKNPELLWLRDHESEIVQGGAKIFPISTATPYFNREAIKRGGKFPFPLLSDPTLQAHQAWRVLDPETKQPVPGLFLLDRLGIIRFSQIGEKPPLEMKKILEILPTLK